MELRYKNALLAEKWVVRIGQALFCLATIVSTVLGSVLWKPWDTDASKEGVKVSEYMLHINPEGPLSLSHPISKQPQPILQQLILIGAHTRPDQDKACILALRTSGEQKILPVGETLFFEVKNETILFSEKNTGMSLTAKSLDKEMLLCDVKNGDTFITCSLPFSPIFAKDLERESYLTTLKQADVWGRDVFLSDWGGDEYREMTQKLKISLGPDVYFLKPGECLWWDGHAWVSEIQSSQPAPLAQLIKTSPQGADFQVWDSTGVASQMIHVEALTPSHTPPKLSELMTAIRPRSPSEITCQLGKRRVIVREGDWWVHTDNRWKLLRTDSDLEACLNHQIPGELFIFEKVETSKGKVVLKGKAFDRMRTVSEPVSLVLQTEKKALGNRKPSPEIPHLAKNKPVVSHSPEQL